MTVEFCRLLLLRLTILIKTIIIDENNKRGDENAHV